MPFTKNLLRTSPEISLESLYFLDETGDLIDFIDDYFILSLTLNEKFSYDVFISTVGGDGKISEAAFDMGLSSRHLQRLYQAKLGIAPKTYLRIMRFIKAKEMLTRAPENSSTHIALACDYYDQAHFIKEFKRFSGLTPNVFRQRQK